MLHISKPPVPSYDFSAVSSVFLSHTCVGILLPIQYPDPSTRPPAAVNPAPANLFPSSNTCPKSFNVLYKIGPNITAPIIMAKIITISMIVPPSIPPPFIDFIDFPNVF